MEKLLTCPVAFKVPFRLTRLTDLIDLNDLIVNDS